jgi:thioredoxin reductase (NADPH)
VLNNKNIKVLFNSQVKSIIGEQKLEQLEIEVDGKNKKYSADGLFLAIGHRPMTKIFASQIDLDNHGYIVTAQSPSQNGVQLAQSRVNEQGLIPLPSMTSAEGVFAAGDVVDLRYRQAITAAGMGCAVALDAEVWLGKQ